MLTKDEKTVVAQYLSSDEAHRKVWWEMWPYLFPPIAFALYGLWKNDIGALAFAFAVLLSCALWYLSAQSRMSVHLHSAMRKYEDAVRALDKPAMDSK